MRNLRILAALGLLTTAAAANAEVTATVTAASDYDFRGITQSAQDPALQASVDYAHESGWYIGGWGSNVDFGDDVDVDYEIDVYTGFSGTSEAGLGWDVGIVYYAYPDESDFDYIEIYGGLTYEWLEGKLSYSNDYGGDSTSGNTPAYYIEGNATFPLPQDFSLLAHVGYSAGDYWDDSDSEYFDYAIGVGYTAGKFDLALKWIDGSDLESADGTPGDVFSSEARLVFTIATTFPWSAD